MIKDFQGQKQAGILITSNNFNRKGSLNMETKMSGKVHTQMNGFYKDERREAPSILKESFNSSSRMPK